GGHFAGIRSNRWNQLLCSRRHHHESDAARTFRRTSSTLAAPVLVLRPSGGLHRGFARDGYGIGHFVDLLPEADFQLPHDGLLDGVDCCPEFHRVGPPHVRQRHESIPGFRLHIDDAADRCSVRREDFQLAWHHVGGPYPVYSRRVVRHRFRVDVCQRRFERNLPWYVGRRYSTAGHVFCRGALPPRHGCRTAVCGICGVVLLVPQDVRPVHERRNGQTPLLADVYWSLLRVFSHARYRHWRSDAPDLRSDAVHLPATPAAG